MTIKTMYVIRGCSGSGKSTLAKAIKAGSACPTTICSADNYPGYYACYGVPVPYNWTPENCRKAHEYCREECRRAIDRGDNVIIDNTNVKHSDYRCYVDAAKAAGYEVTVIAIKPDPEKAGVYANRNLHGVSREIIERMMRSWED